MRLIIATRNKGKLREIREILKGVGLPIVCLEELDKKFRIVENAKTFLGNAEKKALPVSKVYKDDYVLGEDSGLEVEYLNGKPGVYSKRYSGKTATYRSNNLKLLKKLERVPVSERKASFICCLVLAKGAKVIKAFEGRLKGGIAEEAKGKNGFGYDPVLYLPEYKKTAAQIPLSLKNKISHRAKAFGKLKKYLERLQAL
ncbi:MAG: RdgB/HAM1 family non-canonical purine NTP pyrophosphatase [Candidatus Omnitrophota bacterium]